MKRKNWYRRMAGLGLMGFLVGAMAQTTAPALAAPPGLLDSKVELAVKEANPEELFETLGKLMGAEVVLEPGLTGKVSIELHNVRVRTILDALCESVGCQWTLDSLARPPKLRVTPGRTEPRPDPLGKHALPKEPIDLRVTDAEVQDLLQTFGQILGGKAVVDPAIQGKVSLDLQDTPLDLALNAVCMAAGCDWSYDAAARVLRVTPLPHIKRK
jgi:type II secretory pathway component GspD/PulD (secretin)